MKKQNPYKQVIQHGISKLESGLNPTLGCDLHNVLYNEDYFIIGYNAAEFFLKKVGIFEAIGLVQKYEKDQFGEVTTDFSDSEKVANMYAYIKGEEALAECKTVQDNWDNKLTDKDIKAIIKELKQIIKSL